MSNKIGSFINKVQGYIGTQAEMMKQTNDTIKQTLPEDMVEAIEAQASVS